MARGSACGDERGGVPLSIGTFVRDDGGYTTVAVAVALTISKRRDEISRKSVMWADAVLNLWTNRHSTLDGMCFDDNLHPSRIEQYAGSFIKLTTEQD